MILTCPACGTRYVVKDGAIPPGGRQVRCASCKHSWHQDAQEEGGALAEPVAEEPAAETVDDPAPSSSRAAFADPGAEDYEATRPARPEAEPATDRISPDPGPDPLPMPEQPAGDALATVTPDPEPVFAQEAVEVAADYPAEPAQAWNTADQRSDEDFAAYAPDDYEEPRRRGPMLLILALLLIAAIAAAVWFLAPTAFKQRLGIAQGESTPLLVQVDERNRRKLASGNQLLEVSGKVINPTDEPQRVPPLQAQLRSLEQTVVYRWTIPPPAPTLPPGGSASFNSAELNIPASAACLDVSFGDAPGAGPQEPCRAMGGEG